MNFDFWNMPESMRGVDGNGDGDDASFMFCKWQRFYKVLRLTSEQ